MKFFKFPKFVNLTQLKKCLFIKYYNLRNLQHIYQFSKITQNP